MSAYSQDCPDEDQRQDRRLWLADTDVTRRLAVSAGMAAGTELPCPARHRHVMAAVYRSADGRLFVERQHQTKGATSPGPAARGAVAPCLHGGAGSVPTSAVARGIGPSARPRATTTPSRSSARSEAWASARRPTCTRSGHSPMPSTTPARSLPCQWTAHAPVAARPSASPGRLPASGSGVNETFTPDRHASAGNCTAVGHLAPPSRKVRFTVASRTGSGDHIS